MVWGLSHWSTRPVVPARVSTDGEPTSGRASAGNRCRGGGAAGHGRGRGVLLAHDDGVGGAAARPLSLLLWRAMEMFMCRNLMPPVDLLGHLPVCFLVVVLFNHVSLDSCIAFFY